MKGIHGIRKQLDEVMEDLNIDMLTLSAAEIEGWMSELWVLDRGIKGVPVKEGMSCTECDYCCAGKKVMKKHFTGKHRGLKWAENVKMQRSDTLQRAPEEVHPN